MNEPGSRTYSGTDTAVRRRRARARYDRELRRWYRRPALALYGLPGGWDGQREAEPPGLTGTMLPRRWKVDNLRLAHRAAADGETLVVSSYTGSADPSFIDRVAARDLTDRAAGDPGPWQEIYIPVDGAPAPFRLLEAGSDWVAVGRIGDVFLTLVGRRFPWETVRLVRITDTAPYLL